MLLLKRKKPLKEQGQFDPGGGGFNWDELMGRPGPTGGGAPAPKPGTPGAASPGTSALTPGTGGGKLPTTPSATSTASLDVEEGTPQLIADEAQKVLTNIQSLASVFKARIYKLGRAYYGEYQIGIAGTVTEENGDLFVDLTGNALVAKKLRVTPWLQGKANNGDAVCANLQLTYKVNYGIATKEAEQILGANTGAC